MLAKLRVTIHNFTHQLFDHVLTSSPILAASEFCTLYYHRSNYFVGIKRALLIGRDGKYSALFDHFDDCHRAICGSPPTENTQPLGTGMNFAGYRSLERIEAERARNHGPVYWFGRPSVFTEGAGTAVHIYRVSSAASTTAIEPASSTKSRAFFRSLSPTAPPQIKT